MKYLIFFIILFFGCKAQRIKSHSYNKKIMVFLLAGQSNMDGRARAYNLTNEDLKRLEKVKNHVTLYYNHFKPVPLQVTIPTKYIQKKFSAKEVFGPELFFGINLSEKYPDKKIVLIKRSKGGMSLYGAWNSNWSLEKAKAMKEEDDPKLYSDFITYAKDVLSRFDTSEYELSGMLWVQGESDSGKQKFGTIPAESYEENLKNLIRGVRTEFNNSQLPFLIFQVGGGKVVKAMNKVASEDPFTVLIPQSKDKNSDLYFERNPPPIGHYKYNAMKKIGRLFFEYYENNFK
jgi:hypothetical protein